MPQARKKPAAAAAQPDDSTIRFTMAGEPYEIDPSDLSWGEVEEIEMYFDRSVDDVEWETGRGVMMLAYLARHRQDATFSLADMKQLKASDVKLDDGPRPTEPASAAAGSQS